MIGRLIEYLKAHKPLAIIIFVILLTILVGTFAIALSNKTQPVRPEPEQLTEESAEKKVTPKKKAAEKKADKVVANQDNSASSVSSTPSATSDSSVKVNCYDEFQAANKIYLNKKYAITDEKRAAEDDVYYAVLTARNMSYEEGRAILVTLNTNANNSINAAFATYKTALVSKGCSSYVGSPPTPTSPLTL